MVASTSQLNKLHRLSSELIHGDLSDVQALRTKPVNLRALDADALVLATEGIAAGDIYLSLLQLDKATTDVLHQLQELDAPASTGAGPSSTFDTSCDVGKLRAQFETTEIARQSLENKISAEVGLRENPDSSELKIPTLRTTGDLWIPKRQSTPTPNSRRSSPSSSNQFKTRTSCFKNEIARERESFNAKMVASTSQLNKLHRLSSDLIHGDLSDVQALRTKPVNLRALDADALVLATEGIAAGDIYLSLLQLDKATTDVLHQLQELDAPASTGAGPSSTFDTSCDVGKLRAQFETTEIARQSLENKISAEVGLRENPELLARRGTTDLDAFKPVNLRALDADALVLATEGIAAGDIYLSLLQLDKATTDVLHQLQELDAPASTGAGPSSTFDTSCDVGKLRAQFETTEIARQSLENKISAEVGLRENPDSSELKIPTLRTTGDLWIPKRQSTPTPNSRRSSPSSSNQFKTRTSCFKNEIARERESFNAKMVASTSQLNKLHRLSSDLIHGDLSDVQALRTKPVNLRALDADALVLATEGIAAGDIYLSLLQLDKATTDVLHQLQELDAPASTGAGPSSTFDTSCDVGKLRAQFETTEIARQSLENKISAEVGLRENPDSSELKIPTLRTTGDLWIPKRQSTPTPNSRRSSPSSSNQFKTRTSCFKNEIARERESFNAKMVASTSQLNKLHRLSSDLIHGDLSDVQALRTKVSTQHDRIERLMRARTGYSVSRSTSELWMPTLWFWPPKASPQATSTSLLQLDKATTDVLHQLQELDAPASTGAGPSSTFDTSCDVGKLRAQFETTEIARQSLENKISAEVGLRENPDSSELKIPTLRTTGDLWIPKRQSTPTPNSRRSSPSSSNQFKTRTSCFKNEIARERESFNAKMVASTSQLNKLHRLSSELIHGDLSDVQALRTKPVNLRALDADALVLATEGIAAGDIYLSLLQLDKATTDVLHQLQELDAPASTGAGPSSTFDTSCDVGKLRAQFETTEIARQSLENKISAEVGLRENPDSSELKIPTLRTTGDLWIPKRQSTPTPNSRRSSPSSSNQFKTRTSCFKNEIARERESFNAKMVASTSQLNKLHRLSSDLIHGDLSDVQALRTKPVNLRALDADALVLATEGIAAGDIYLSLLQLDKATTDVLHQLQELDAPASTGAGPSSTFDTSCDVGKLRAQFETTEIARQSLENKISAEVGLRENPDSSELKIPTLRTTGDLWIPKRQSTPTPNSRRSSPSSSNQFKTRTSCFKNEIARERESFNAKMVASTSQLNKLHRLSSDLIHGDLSDVQALRTKPVNLRALDADALVLATEGIAAGDIYLSLLQLDKATTDVLHQLQELDAPASTGAGPSSTFDTSCDVGKLRAQFETTEIARQSLENKISAEVGLRETPSCSLVGVLLISMRLRCSSSELKIPTLRTTGDLWIPKRQSTPTPNSRRSSPSSSNQFKTRTSCFKNEIARERESFNAKMVASTSQLNKLHRLSSDLIHGDLSDVQALRTKVSTQHDRIERLMRARTGYSVSRSTSELWMPTLWFWPPKASPQATSTSLLQLDKATTDVLHQLQELDAPASTGAGPSSTFDTSCDVGKLRAQFETTEIARQSLENKISAEVGLRENPDSSELKIPTLRTTGDLWIPKRQSTPTPNSRRSSPSSSNQFKTRTSCFKNEIARERESFNAKMVASTSQLNKLHRLSSDLIHGDLSDVQALRTKPVNLRALDADALVLATEGIAAGDIYLSLLQLDKATTDVLHQLQELDAPLPHTHLK
ncbi:hypothetical protein GN958_ATG03216 [Phytophthora infestans]|uniref:Uncharacterized protein n=1 Tax=Phytophthora infestans TaxID=4787 RepID=A0A8S9V331_PHYIN|nr:hypothetical protein GN958_ATG03216 [Phytophthora infestans]